MGLGGGAREMTGFWMQGEGPDMDSVVIGGACNW